MTANIIGVLVALPCFVVAFLASRRSMVAESSMRDPSLRTLAYLLAAAFSYQYPVTYPEPVGHDPVKWMLFVLVTGVGLGYFSRLFSEPT